ncbi:hypothetical protein ACQUW1_23320, partial [Klebsiella pneumoniae]
FSRKMPRYSQFRLAIIVWPAGSLLKKYGMVNPPVRRGISATGVWSHPLSFLVRVQVLILNSPGGTLHHA